MKLRDLISMNTLFSSMRWAFVTLVRLGVGLAGVIVLAVVFNAFREDGKKIDVGSLLLLETTILSTAFTGKAIQSFSKNDSGTTDDSQTPPA